MTSSNTAFRGKAQDHGTRGTQRIGRKYDGWDLPGSVLRARIDDDNDNELIELSTASSTRPVREPLLRATFGEPISRPLTGPAVIGGVKSTRNVFTQSAQRSNRPNRRRTRRGQSIDTRSLMDSRYNVAI